MNRSLMNPNERNLPIQKRAREKYELILQVTCDLLVERGFSGLSTREIARRANCNIATVYRYFGSTNDIVMALGEPFFNGISELFDHMSSQLIKGDSLESVIRFFLTSLTEEVRQNTWILHAEAGVMTDKELIQWNVNFLEKIQIKLSGVLALASLKKTTAELERLSYRLVRHWKTYLRTLIEYDELAEADWLLADTVNTSVALVEALIDA